MAQVKFVSFFTKLLKYKPELNRIEIGLRAPDMVPVCTYVKESTLRQVFIVFSYFKLNSEGNTALQV